MCDYFVREIIITINVYFDLADFSKIKLFWKIGLKKLL